MLSYQLVLGVIFLIISGFFVFSQIMGGRLHFLIALHLLIFWLNILLYGVISLVIHEIDYEPKVFLLTLFLILFYIICLNLLSPKLKNSHADTILYIITHIPLRPVQVILIIWLLTKIYFYYKFGIYGFWMITFREMIGVNEIEIMTSVIMSHMALGAIFVFTIKIGTSMKELSRNPFNILLWLLSLLIFSFLKADLGLGARRTIIFLGVALFLSNIYGSEKIRLKQVVFGISIALFIIQLTIIYQMVVRPTLANFEQHGYVDHVRNPSSFFIDFMGSDRYPPIWLLYHVTNEQIGDFKVGQGRFLKQAIINLIPRIFLPTKHYVDPDELLSEKFNLPLVDLPTSVLVSFQAEMFFLAYLIVPIILILLYKVYKWLIIHYERIDALLTIGILGNIFLILQSVEASLEQILGAIRATVIILIFLGTFHIVRRIFKLEKIKFWLRDQLSQHNHK